MSVRSNGVMKVRRTATSTCRVTSSASGSRCKNLLTAGLDAIAASQQSAKRFGTCDNDGRVLLKEMEKALLARHERLKPAKHVRVPHYVACAATCLISVAPNHWSPRPELDVVKQRGINSINLA